MRCKTSVIWNSTWIGLAGPGKEDTIYFLFLTVDSVSNHSPIETSYNMKVIGIKGLRVRKEFYHTSSSPWPFDNILKKPYICNKGSIQKSLRDAPPHVYETSLKKSLALAVKQTFFASTCRHLYESGSITCLTDWCFPSLQWNNFSIYVDILIRCQKKRKDRHIWWSYWPLYTISN